MAQFARPDSDIATGSWTTTPLWSKIDEGATGDGTTISSDNNTAPDNTDFTLSNISDPGVDTNHIIRAKWNKDSSSGHSINAVAELWQGTPGTGTLIATLSVTGIGATPTTSTYTLSSAEAGNITDYSSITLRLSRQGDTGGPPNGRRSLVVDFAELEVPDAATQVNGNLTGPSATLSSNTSVLVAGDSSLTGPSATLSASSQVILKTDSSLTGPTPIISGDVTASVSRTVDASLTGSSPTLSSSLKTLLSTNSNLISPSPTLSSSGKILLKISSNTVGPLPSLSSTLDNSVSGNGQGQLMRWRGRGRVCAARRMQPGFMGTKFK